MKEKIHKRKYNSKQTWENVDLYYNKYSNAVMFQTSKDNFMTVTFYAAEDMMNKL